MNTVDLPALDGRRPLGFLAALGVTRLLTVHDGDGSEPPKLCWRSSERSAVLHSRYESVDAVVAALNGIVAAIPSGAVIPGGPPGLPPPGGLRLLPAHLRQLLLDLGGETSPEAEGWVGSLVTDLSLDDRGRTDISLMCAPSGQQTMYTMLDKPLALVRDHPSYLREALVGWRRQPGVSGEYLDHQVLYDAADAGDGLSEERGVPGATWLAIMAYPLLRTTADGADPVTTGWQRRNGQREFVFPLWSKPLDMYAIVALLEHPMWAVGVEELPPGGETLSVFEVGRARRRRIPGRTFAGVLGPTL